MRVSHGHFTTKLRRALFRPRITASTVYDTVRLGSEYGGWTFVDDSELSGSLILSFGMGEDASFDVEFAARYGATVFIYDPTPRAIIHFGLLSQRIGTMADTSYTFDGKQPVDSYDLSNVASNQLQYFETAVSDRSGTAKFFAPADARHVSYSLVNLQNTQEKISPGITVTTTSVVDIQESVSPKGVALVKMDIEGAENRVLRQMLETDFLPKQLLVEFDELNFPSRGARARFDDIHGRILGRGYSVSHWDKRSCISYIRGTVT